MRKILFIEIWSRVKKWRENKNIDLYIENILLDPTRHLKISDFGTAEILTKESNGKSWESFGTKFETGRLHLLEQQNIYAQNY